MISSVSAVSFKSSAPGAQVQDPIGRPGAYTKPEVVSPKADKDSKGKHGFLKGLISTVAAVVVVGGLLVAGFKKGALKVLDAAALKDANILKKAGHYLGKAGELLDAKVWQKIPGIARNTEKAA